jgi:hypothetical protein
VVWDLPLQGDPGGPSSISGTAPLVEFDLLHRSLLAFVSHSHRHNDAGDNRRVAEQEEDVSMTEPLAPFANGYRPDFYNWNRAIE